MNRTDKEELRLQQAWQAVAGSAEGAHIIADIMHMGNLIDPIETSDPIVMAQAVGAQNLAKQILRYVGTDPAQYVSRTREANDVRRELTDPRPADEYSYEKHLNQYIQPTEF